MPRVTVVKSAQQRYKMVPVLDEDGNQTYRERHLKRPTKKGVTVTRQRVTKADTSQPLPPLRCDYGLCAHADHAIKVGQSYKWIKPKSGPYGGQQRNRHADHPSWHEWEYSSSMSARIAQIQHEAYTGFDPSHMEGPEDMTAYLESVAEEIRALAEEKRESASNIEEGFGHETEQSAELNDIAEQLDTWADEVAEAEVPDLPEPSEADQSEWPECAECSGSGEAEETCTECEGSGVKANEDGTQGEDEDCPDCDGEGVTHPECTECEGEGVVEPEEVTEGQMDGWRESLEEVLSIVDDCPV